MARKVRKAKNGAGSVDDIVNSGLEEDPVYGPEYVPDVPKPNPTKPSGTASKPAAVLILEDEDYNPENLDAKQKKNLAKELRAKTKAFFAKHPGIAKAVIAVSVVVVLGTITVLHFAVAEPKQGARDGMSKETAAYVVLQQNDLENAIGDFGFRDWPTAAYGFRLLKALEKDSEDYTWYAKAIRKAVASQKQQENIEALNGQFQAGYAQASDYIAFKTAPKAQAEAAEGEEQNEVVFTEKDYIDIAKAEEIVNALVDAKYVTFGDDIDKMMYAEAFMKAYNIGVKNYIEEHDPAMVEFRTGKEAALADGFGELEGRIAGQIDKELGYSPLGPDEIVEEANDSLDDNHANAIEGKSDDYKKGYRAGYIDDFGKGYLDGYDAALNPEEQAKTPVNYEVTPEICQQISESLAEILGPNYPITGILGVSKTINEDGEDPNYDIYLQNGTGILRVSLGEASMYDGNLYAALSSAEGIADFLDNLSDSHDLGAHQLTEFRSVKDIVEDPEGQAAIEEYLESLSPDEKEGEYYLTKASSFEELGDGTKRKQEMIHAVKVEKDEEGNITGCKIIYAGFNFSPMDAKKAVSMKELVDWMRYLMGDEGVQPENLVSGSYSAGSNAIVEHADMVRLHGDLGELKPAEGTTPETPDTPQIPDGSIGDLISDVLGK